MSAAPEINFFSKLFLINYFHIFKNKIFFRFFAFQKNYSLYQIQQSCLFLAFVDIEETFSALVELFSSFPEQKLYTSTNRTNRRSDR